jgi:phage/plasmid-associated DNA primase
MRRSGKGSESSKKSFSSSVECDICHKQWDTKGFGNHRRACEKKYFLTLQQKEYEKQVEASTSNPNCKFHFVSAAEYY